MTNPLYVFHMAKASVEQKNPFAKLPVFCVESCLRFIAISRTIPETLPSGTSVYQAEEAYRFLLEVACGLHSRIQGESEIFGQIKQAWKQQGAKHNDLNTLMQHVFADTKRIRTAYLHGIGGQSYASATQKLLPLKKSQSVLVIGAGQLGAMFMTKLGNVAKKMTVMNRSEKQSDAFTIIGGWDELETQMEQHDHVLVTIPHHADPELDARIQSAWSQKTRGTLIHFGLMHLADTAWGKSATHP